MKHFPLIVRFFLALLALLALAGCPKEPAGPQPEDTVVGDYASRGRSSSPDWINESSINVSEGLTPREVIIVEGAPKVTHSSVYFDFDSFAIRPQDRAALDQAAQYLNTHPNISFTIVGHCDWYGTAEYNLVLGEKRAQSAKNYLTGIGAPMNRIKTATKGSLDATPNLSKPEAIKDRRADLLIIE